MIITGQTLNAQAGLLNNAPATLPGFIQGRQQDLLVSEIMPKYYQAAYAGVLYWAKAIVTAPVIFSTAASTGGPLLWNASTNMNLVLLKLTCGITTVSTAAGSLGIATGVSTVPSATTAVDSLFNCKNPGVLLTQTPNAQVSRVATPSAAATNFIPAFSIGTGALTVEDGLQMTWEIDGSIIVPPGSFASPAGSATLSTLVTNIGLLWMEVPA